MRACVQSIEAVHAVESIKALGSVCRLGAAYLLMWTFDYGLDGYAYASAVSYGLTLLLVLVYTLIHCPTWSLADHGCFLLISERARPLMHQVFIVCFVVQGEHKDYWPGWDLAAILNPKLNKRFLYLAVPMMVQYALQNGSIFYYQMLMSAQDCNLAAAYGATGAFTNTGGSVSLAIYVAVSVRVGTCLGASKPANATSDRPNKVTGCTARTCAQPHHTVHTLTLCALLQARTDRTMPSKWLSWARR